MRLCEVIGTVVGAAHHPTYDGRKLLLVRPIHPGGQALGKGFIAVDDPQTGVQAGVGDRVLVMSEGNGVRQILGKDTGPIRSLIVGVVDAIDAPAASAAPSRTSTRS